MPARRTAAETDGAATAAAIRLDCGVARLASHAAGSPERQLQARGRRLRRERVSISRAHAVLQSARQRSRTIMEWPLQLRHWRYPVKRICSASTAEGLDHWRHERSRSHGRSRRAEPLHAGIVAEGSQRGHNGGPDQTPPARSAANSEVPAPCQGPDASRAICRRLRAAGRSRRAAGPQPVPPCAVVERESTMKAFRVTGQTRRDDSSRIDDVQGTAVGWRQPPNRLCGLRPRGIVQRRQCCRCALKERPGAWGRQAGADQSA
jgi:hypothetical protein